MDKLYQKWFDKFSAANFSFLLNLRTLKSSHDFLFKQITMIDKKQIF